MDIKMYLNLIKVDNFAPDEEKSLTKNYESNYIPRKDERILDEAIPDKYLVVKNVTWDIQKNICILELNASGTSRTKNLEELVNCFLKTGWSETK